MKVSKEVKAKKALKAKQAKVRAKTKAVPLKKKPAKAQDEPSIVDEENTYWEHCEEEEEEEQVSL
jgi:hypothetical protein